jgi:hypothetical protein
MPEYFSLWFTIQLTSHKRIRNKRHQVAAEFRCVLSTNNETQLNEPLHASYGVYDKSMKNFKEAIAPLFYSVYSGLLLVQIEVNGLNTLIVLFYFLIGAVWRQVYWHGLRFYRREKFNIKV